MPSTSKLFSIEYVDDDDTGMYQMGEITGLPTQDLEMYIERYGSENLLNLFVGLIHKVKSIDDQNRSKVERLESLNCGIGNNPACK